MKSAHIFLSLFFIACLAQVSFGQITGTDHDFSSDNWNTSGEICIVCHTPHNSDLTVTDAPLWNHQVTATTFTLYTSGTLDATTGQPAGNSKLCLSCHDGTVALENYGGATGSTTLTGDALIGTDLSDDHPISMTYDDALATADGGLNAPSTALSGLGGTISADMLFGTGSDQLQCASCHDVHNGANIDYLLVKSNAASALCLTCHDK